MQLMLMTGWLNSGSFISDTTLGSFEDLGYNTTLNLAGAAAVPEPDTLLFYAMGSGLVVFARKRVIRRAA